MKKFEFKRMIKQFLLAALGVFLFYFIPFCLTEGFKIALSAAFLFVADFCAIGIVLIIIYIWGNHKKKPRINRKNKHFIREFPQDYSVAVASLLVSNLFDESVAIPATILSLIGKSILKYENKKITSVPNVDLSNLSEHEKYLYWCFSTGSKINPTRIQCLVTEDAVNKGYIEEIKIKDYTKVVIRIFLILMFVTYFSIFLVTIFDFLYIIIPITMITTFIFCFFSSMYLFTKQEMIRKNPYKNTKIGQKELQKLLNLKDYLNEFSDFKKAEIEESILWEDYIAYAYIFNINKNLYDEFEEIKQLSHLYKETDY